MTGKTAASPEHDLLNHCPRCKYRLMLQPVRHTCPECGLSIDRRAFVFGGVPLAESPDRWQVLIAAITFTLLAGFGYFYIPPVARPWVILALVAPFGLIIMPFLWTKGFILVGPEDLVIHHHPRRIVRYPMSEVRKACYGLFLATIHIRLESETIRLYVFRFFSRNAWNDTDRCLRAINQYAGGEK